MVILSACGQPQQRRRLQQPRFERLLLVCHGELGYQRLVSQPQHGQLAEQPEQQQQDKRLLRPLPSELTIYLVRYTIIPHKKMFTDSPLPTRSGAMVNK